MNRKIHLINMTLAVSMMALVAKAELRTWVDSDGTKLEAEFVEHCHSQVTLRTKDKNVIHVSISDLSADDQKYVLRNTPPKFEINVSEITDRHNEGFGGDRRGGFQIQYGTVQFKATLTKDSTIPYAGQLTAELYIIGFQTVEARYALLDKTVETFSFETSGSGKHEFKSHDINMKQLEAGGTIGAQYEGYYMVLLDDQGRVFQTKGSRSMFDEHAETIRKQKKGDVIDQDKLLPLHLGGGSDGPGRRSGHGPSGPGRK